MLARFYVGTYTDRYTDTGEKSGGIYCGSLDLSTGHLTITGVTPHDENPSYLAVSHSGRFLYAVSELDTYAAITGYEIGQDGVLQELSKREYPGAAMCHLAISPDDRYVLASNYTSGTVLSISLGVDGSLGDLCCEMHHRGSGLDALRQQAPHAHSARFTPDGKQVIAADLGTDALYTYHFDSAMGKLLLACQTKVIPGEGPRHFDFLGEDIYLITELGNHVQRLVPNQDFGLYAMRENFSSLPSDFVGKSAGADIHVSSDHRFVYASNRGSDTIFVGEVTPNGLQPQAAFACGGKTPRNFALSPGENYFVIANQDSHVLVAMARDSGTGNAVSIASTASIPYPVCVCFVGEEV